MRSAELKSALKERLYRRQLQSATYGISADPSITIEIEALEAMVNLINQAEDAARFEAHESCRDREAKLRARGQRIGIEIVIPLEYDDPPQQM